MFFSWTIWPQFEGNISPSFQQVFIEQDGVIVGSILEVLICAMGEMFPYVVIFPLKSSGSAEI